MESARKFSSRLRREVHRLQVNAFDTATPLESSGYGANGTSTPSYMVVLHGAGDEAGGGGVFAPVVDVDGGEVAEDGGQRLALRPVVGELGAEPREAVGDLAALRRAPDRVEGVADEAATERGVAQIAALELGGGLQAGPVRLGGVEQGAVVADAEAAGELLVDAGTEVAVAFDIEPLAVGMPPWSQTRARSSENDLSQGSLDAVVARTPNSPRKRPSSSSVVSRG